jgi:large subunit ribosomal protein L17
MRHKKSKIQLNRFTSWRKATLISLAKNLLIYQSIKTTTHKAKAVRPLIDKLITLAKKNNLAAKRRAFNILGNHKLVNLLFSDIAPRFKDKTSGFIRIIALGKRRGDNAELAILELTEIKKKEIKKPKKEKETKPIEETKVQTPPEEPVEEKKPEPRVSVKEKHPVSEKPSKKFLGGIRNIFKKERDSL